MISVKEAEFIIAQNCEVFAPVRVPIEETFGRVLRENIMADRDMPPFHRVAMDGIAIHFLSWKEGRLDFPVAGIQKAGSPGLVLNDKQSCFEVMTGAILPEGCDCVIPIENVAIEDGVAKLREGFKLTLMQNIHPKGADGREGDLLLSKKTVLLAPQLATAASAGKASINVTQIPKIAIIGTGDELVPINQRPSPYQIRRSNALAIQSALNLKGFPHIQSFHINDDEKQMRDVLEKILDEYDFLILSGGVSMGKFDFVPQVLSALNVKVLFHKVKQRPGKPFWFGKNAEGKLVFALPGNPTSTLICFYRYVLPHLIKTLGVSNQPQEFAILAKEVQIKTTFTYFLPVNIHPTHDGRLMVEPVYLNGSGDYARLARSDGFVELEESTHTFSKETIVPLYRWGG